ncbi:hypothetical protein [Cystobacter fuscus]|uniref:hypothetical protein n=1 Tax=Cystobacter fuscus TaxID=43 RepID=UPI002B2CFC37|nr:hypothetical protein F0U63_43045 [Cystobacter fuscus]
MSRVRLAVSAGAFLLTIGVAQVSSAQVPSYVDPVVYEVDPTSFPTTSYPGGYQLNNNYEWESSYPFAGSYSATEQELIIKDELVRTGGTRSTDSDGSTIINIDQGIIPEANQGDITPPLEVNNDNVAPSGTAPFTKSYYRSDNLGNSVFGAGYIIDASMTSTPATGTAEKRVEAHAEGKVYAVAFGAQKEIVRGRAEVSGQAGGNNSGTASLYAMGQQVWSGNLYYSFEITPINWSRTFFSASKRFMVGPVPVSVSASISGGLKLTVSGQIGPTIARLSATAGGWANANASAGVDIVVAGVGVEGAVTLINVSLPAFAELFWPFYSLDWKLKADLSLNTLNGNLKLWVRVGFWFFKKTWRLTIASWSGYTQNINVYNNAGSLILGIDPM